MEKHPVLLFDFDGVIMRSVGPSKLMAEKLQDPRLKWNQSIRNSLNPNDLIRMFELSSRPSNLESLQIMNQNFTPLLPSFIHRWHFFLTVAKHIPEYERKFNHIFPDICPTLMNLRKMGITLGIISNSKRERIERWLIHSNIQDFFSVIVTRDDRKQYLIKPDPRPILGALIQLKRKYRWKSVDRSYVGYVGDNIIDVQAAHRAKVKAIAILTGHGTLHSLELQNPSVILESFGQILNNISHIFPDFEISSSG
ncbi:MAG: HAD family hydrolase [Promethearchaeota archaeon]